MIKNSENNIILPNILLLGLFSDFLFDKYPFEIGYSLRQLNSAIVNAIRVKREDNGLEQDIGFVDGDLDILSLTSFCNSPATNGLVTIWYDQSGNGHNLVQLVLSKMSKIYDQVTGVVLENGIPALDFVSLKHLLSSYTLNPSISIGISRFSVFRPRTLLSSGDFISSLGNGGTGVEPDVWRASQLAYTNTLYNSNVQGDNAILTGGTLEFAQTLVSLIANDSEQTLYVKGSQVAQTNFSLGAYANLPFRLAVGTTEFDLDLRNTDSKIQELIYYFSSVVPRLGIEGDINNYYQIY